MEEDLLALLRGDEGVIASMADRVNWVLRPQGKAYPGATLTKVSFVPDYTFAGPSGFGEYRVQVDVWAKTFTSVTDAARAIKGAVEAVPYADIQGIFIIGERDLTDATLPDVIFHTSIDLMVAYSKP